MSFSLFLSHFRYMLSIGDLLWVPFTFTMQARFMAFHPVSLSPTALTALTFLSAASYYTFRSSNSQKNAFRTHGPASMPHLNYIPTKTGSKLLISGWWGVSRHINVKWDADGDGLGIIPSDTFI